MSEDAQKDFFDEAAGGTGHPALKFGSIGDQFVGVILDTPRPVMRPNLNNGAPEKQLPVNMDVNGEPRTLWIGAGQLATAVREAYEAAGAAGLAKGGKLGVKFVEEQDTGKPNKMKVFAAKYEPPVAEPATVGTEELF